MSGAATRELQTGEQTSWRWKSERNNRAWQKKKLPSFKRHLVDLGEGDLLTSRLEINVPVRATRPPIVS